MQSPLFPSGIAGALKDPWTLHSGDIVTDAMVPIVKAPPNCAIRTLIGYAAW